MFQRQINICSFIGDPPSVYSPYASQHSGALAPLVKQSTDNRGLNSTISASKLEQFHLSHFACVFRKIRYKPLVLSISCLYHGK